MTLDDLDLFQPDDRVPLVQPAKCRRHVWVERLDGTTTCDRCSRPLDRDQASRNTRARKRGFRTSHDLAAYLGGRDVDKNGWPWDVEARGARIQSKRLAQRPSHRAMVALIEAIDYRVNELRAVFYVEPRQRLTSGVIVCGLRDWVDWHNWAIPQEARISHGAAGTLLELPLPVFRDIHIGVPADTRRVSNKEGNL